MPDETYRIYVESNLQQFKADADGATQSVKELLAQRNKASEPSTAQIDYGNILQKIYEQHGAETARDYAKQAGIDYDSWAKSAGIVAQEQNSINSAVRTGSNDVKTIASNFNALIGTGRAMSELGRAGSIFGNLFVDKDLVRVSQLTVAMGDLTMVVGRIPQVFKALGASAELTMGQIALITGGVVAGIAAIAALSKINNQSPQQAVQGPFAVFGDSGRQTGKETREWLKSIGVELPNLGEAANRAINGVDNLGDATKQVADRMKSYGDALGTETDKIDKMNAHQAEVQAKTYADINKVANFIGGAFGVHDPLSYLQTVATNRIGAATEENTPLGQLNTAIQSGNIGGVNSVLPSNAINLEKSSQQEINQAKQLSVNLTRAEIQARVEQAAALGATKEQQAALVKLLEDEVSKSLQLVNINGQLSYLKGEEAYRFSEAQSNIKASQPDFNFQRLGNVSAGQFPQLQGLAQMYNDMLTKLGSPEKSQNINLLLEGGVFKTMNVRMTALQLALEDLTKVEKAQLSGTWNLPAGATALVPISSLDIQRWNKSEGSGLSADALRALMNATNGSGDKVSQSQQLAASRIIAAIHENFYKSGLSTAAVDKAKTPSEAIALVPSTIRDAFTQAFMMRDMATNIMQGKAFGALPDSISQQMKSQQVTITALPIKANLTTSVSIALNGMVVARAIMPFLFDLLARTTASSGYKKVGITR